MQACISRLINVDSEVTNSNKKLSECCTADSEKITRLEIVDHYLMFLYLLVPEVSDSIWCRHQLLYLLERSLLLWSRILYSYHVLCRSGILYLTHTLCRPCRHYQCHVLCSCHMLGSCHVLFVKHSPLMTCAVSVTFSSSIISKEHLPLEYPSYQTYPYWCGGCDVIQT